MVLDISKVYDETDAFFDPSGNATMKLTPAAAKRVCVEAAMRGFLVLCVEGGIYVEGMFEARLDCIWDGSESATSRESMTSNNKAAAQFIEDNSQIHNAFIITVSSHYL